MATTFTYKLEKKICRQFEYLPLFFFFYLKMVIIMKQQYKYTKAIKRTQAFTKMNDFAYRVSEREKLLGTM